MFGSNYYYGTTSVAALYASSGDAYAIGGVSPATVADFAGTLNSGTEYYRTAGSETTFSDMFTYSDTGSLGVMTDSDGNLKWKPHNLVINSASPANQSVTTVVGASYTVKITGSGSVALTGAGTGTVTAGSPVTITATTTTLTLTLTGSPTTMWCFRSDLGGMVNDPDSASDYVATTGSARFLARRNHYRYNGASYSKKGILLESAAATNVCTSSTDLTTTWAIANTDSITITSNQGTGPDGNTSLDELAITDTTNEHHDIRFTFTGTAANWTGSIYVDDVDQQYVGLRFYTSANEWAVAVFNLTAGTVTQESDGSGTTAIVGGKIEQVASGLYRISLTATLTAASTIFAVQTHSGATPTLTATDGTEAYAGAGTESFYAGFVNIELGSVPTSHIPSNINATVTRAAETLTIAGADMAASTTAMSFHIQGEVSFADTDSEEGLFKWVANADNSVEATVLHAASRTGWLQSEQEASNVVDVVNSGGDDIAPGVNVAFNLAQRHTTSELNSAVSGTANTANATVTAVPDLSSATLEFGVSRVASAKYQGTIALFRQDDSDWTDTGIEEATS